MSIEPLYSFKQLAAITKRSVAFFEDLADSGEIEVIRRSDRAQRYILESAWLAWQESHKQATSSKVAQMPPTPPKQAPARPKPFNVDDLLPPGFVKPFPRSA